VTLDAAPTQNNLLVATLRIGGADSTLTGPGGGWTKAVAQDRGTQESVSIWYKIAGAGESATHTWSISGGAQLTELEIYEFSGNVTASVLDKINSFDNGTGTATSIQPGSTGTLGQANEVIVTIAGTVGGNGGTEAIDSTFNIQDAATFANNTTGYKIVAVTTAENPTHSWATGSRCAAAIASFKAAGGTITQKSLGGSVTPSGALAKRGRKTIGGAVTPAGSVAKKASRHLAGAVTPTGMLAKRPRKTIGGSDTPTGSLVRRARKHLAGADTPSGTLRKRARRFFAGTDTPTGSITKKAMIHLAGADTPTGALSMTRKLRRFLSGETTPTGTLGRLTHKQLAGTVTSEGAVTRKTSKRFTGATTPTGTLNKRGRLTFAGSVTATGQLYRRARKRLAGATTPSGTLHRKTSKRFAGAVTPIGTLRKLAKKQFSGSSTPSGSLLVVVAQALRNLIWRASRLVGRYRTSGLRERDRWKIGGPFE